MDRQRAAGVLLALAAYIACSAAAPTASNQTALDLYEGAPEGCYYNFQHYGEGDRIMTNEPCLNCTCHNRMLMCYLRVCPFTKPIGQDCTVEKRADQCCPIVTCPDVPVDLLTSTSTSSPAEYGATGLDKVNKYGCSIKGKYFPEGSKVPPTPNKPCEHCYCIRNMTTCVMQECTLHVDGCTPIYHKDVCCPVRYSCDHPEDEIPLLDDMSTTVRPTPGFLLTTTTLAPATQMTQDCVHDDQIFADGASIKTEKPCEHCYCMKGDIVCVVQECGTPMENEGKNCTSLPPRHGQCCPDTYICEGDALSTDSYTEPTTELGLEKLTTLSPPMRGGVEGSGYRNEPDEVSYTPLPTDAEVEGSGDVQEIAKPDVKEPLKPEKPIDADNIIPVTQEDDLFSSATSTMPTFEGPAATTEMIEESAEEVTRKPQIYTTVPPVKEDIDKLTTSELTEEEALEPHDHISTASQPADDSYERATTEYSEPINTISDATDEKESKPHEYGSSTVSTTITEESESSKPLEDENIKPTLSQEEHSTTQQSEYDTLTTKPTSEIVEKQTNAPTDVFTVTPGLMTEEEHETDIGRTGTPFVTQEDKESTTVKITQEMETSETEKHISVTTSIPDQEKITTEVDHAQNTVAVAEEESTYPYAHVPSTTTTLTGHDVSTAIIDKEPHKHLPTTIPSLEDIKTTTAEPDKGLNTIPNEINEEISSEPSSADRTTMRSTEIKSTAPTESLEYSTLIPDTLVTKGDQYTITTEPSFRKEDESSVSTQKPKEIEASTVKVEFEDEGLIPTYGDKLNAGSEVPYEDITTSLPEYAGAIETKQPTTEPTLQSSVSSDSPPAGMPEAVSKPEEELLSSTEKVSDISPSISEGLTTNEEPSRIPGEGDCLLDGVTYRNNSNVPSNNKCHSSCKCASSIIKCDPIICSPAPNYMGNCATIYDPLDSCCPTYVCDHPKETIPPQSDNQMSGTESPVPPPTIQCRGDQCEIIEPEKHHDENICGLDGCGDEIQKPVALEPYPEQPDCLDGKCGASIDDCPNGDCGKIESQVTPVQPCTGEHCTQHVPQEVSDVKIPTIQTSPCVGESCKKEDCGDGGCGSDVISPVPDAQVDCSGNEPCRRKEISPIGDQLPCKGSECTDKSETGIEQEPQSPVTTEPTIHKVTESDIMVDISVTPDHHHEVSTQKDQSIPVSEAESTTALPGLEQENTVPVEETITEGPTEFHEKEQEDIQTEKPIDIDETTAKSTITDSESKFEPIGDEKSTEPSTAATESEEKPVDTDKVKETVEEVGTEFPSSIDGHDIKQSTVLDELSTVNPVVEKELDKTEKSETQKPSIIDEDVTKAPILISENESSVAGEESTEKHVITKEDSTDKPVESEDEYTLKPLEGESKPVESEDVSTIKPFEEEDKPVESEDANKLKPLEEGEKSVTSDDKHTTISFEEEMHTTNTPLIERENDKSTIAAQDSTEKSVAQHEVIDQTTYREDVATEKPVVTAGDSKEKPTDIKEKPVLTEQGVTETSLIDEENNEKPDSLIEKVTNIPIISEEQPEDIPTDAEKAEKPFKADMDEGTETSAVMYEDSERSTTSSQTVTDKPSFAEEEEQEKPTGIIEESSEKPVAPKEQVTDKDTSIEEDSLLIPVDVKEKPVLSAGAEDETNIGITGSPIAGDEQFNTEKTIDDTYKQTPTIIDEERTDSPATLKEEDKEKPTSVEKASTVTPSMMEDDNKEITTVENGGTETPLTTDDVSEDKPKGDEGGDQEKPTAVEEAGAEKPSEPQAPEIEEKGTETPIIAEGGSKLKPTEEDTSMPTDAPADKPTATEDESKLGPTGVQEESTEKLTETEEEVTEKYENDKILPSSDVQEQEKEKPSGDREEDTENTGKPSDAEEAVTQKPIPSEDREEEKPSGYEEEEIKKPTSDAEETETQKPIPTEDREEEKPSGYEEEEIMKPTSDAEETEKQKPIPTEDGGEDKPSGYEGEEMKKPTEDESKLQPTDVKEESTDKVSAAEEGTEKPAVIEDENLLKPTDLEEAITEKFPDTEAEGTEKPAVIEDESKLKPTGGIEESTEKFTGPEEQGTEKPVIIEDDSTLKPISVLPSDDENMKKPVDIEDESKLRPTDVDEGHVTSPAIDEKEDTGMPVTPEDESKLQPSDVGTEKPTDIEYDRTGPPTIDEEESTAKPIIEDEGILKPTDADEEITEIPAGTEREGAEKPTGMESDSKFKPIYEDEESTEKLTDTEKDGLEKPDVTKDESELSPTDVGQEITEKSTDIAEGSEKPSINEDDSPIMPVDISEESTMIPPHIADDGKEKPIDTEDESQFKPTGAEEVTKMPVSVEDDSKLQPVDVTGDSTDKPTIDIEKDIEIELKPTHVEEGIQKEPADTEKEFTDKPDDIEDGTKSKPISVDEQSTEEPTDTEDKATEIPALSEDDTKLKPVGAEDESTEIPVDIEHDVKEKPTSVDKDDAEKPMLTEDDSKKKPTGIEDIDKEIPATPEQGDKDKPTDAKEDGMEKVTSFYEEGTERPATFEDEAKEKPTVVDDKEKEEPASSPATGLEDEGTESPSATEEETKEEPTDTGKEKPIIVGEDGIEKPSIVDEDKKEKPTGSEIEGTEQPIMLDEDIKGIPTPSIDDLIKTPDEVEKEKTGKPTVTDQIAPEEPQTEIQTEKYTPETPQEGSVVELQLPGSSIKPTDKESDKSPEHATKPTVTETGHPELPAIVTETVPEFTTRDQPELESSTRDQLVERVTKPSEPEVINELEETSTHIPEYELDVTKRPESGPADTEPQAGFEQGSTQMPESVKPEIPESHITESVDSIEQIPDHKATSMLPEQSETTERVPETTEKDILITKSPESHIYEPSGMATDHPTEIDEQEVKTETPQGSSPEKEVTESSVLLTTEPVRSFTEIEDSFVTGQEDLVTGYPERTTDEQESLVTEKSTDSPISYTEKDILDQFESLTTEQPVSVEPQSHELPHGTEENIYSQDKKTTRIPDISDNVPAGTIQPDIYTEEQVTRTEVPMLHVTVSGDGPHVTGSQETFTKSEVPELTEIEKLSTDGPITSINVEYAETKAPVTEIHLSSTELPKMSEETQTDLPSGLITSQAPQSLVTDHETKYTEISQEPESTQYEEGTKRPEIYVTEEEKIQMEDNKTEEPAHVTESAEPVIKITTEYEEKLTTAPEEVEQHYTVPTSHEIQPDTVTDKLDVHTKLPERTTDKHGDETTEELTSQSGYSETTPYLIELEEHTHKMVEPSSTLSPLEDDRTTPYSDKKEGDYITDVSTEKATEIEISTGETEMSSSPIDQASSVAPVEAAEEEIDRKHTTLPPYVSEESTPGIQMESEQPTVASAASTEKEIPQTEKEEFIYSTPKATTSKQEEELQASIDDKFTKPEEKPSETSELVPPGTTAEVPKPGIADMQPTDEIPAPEDDGHFPPSGSSGYGEPDYAEEDQAFGPGTCRYGGKVYVSAQQIPRDDPCDFCFCFRSDIICLQQSCPPPIHGCHEEPIQGFCCPRYECPVSMATTVNVTTTTTTTTTTLPPHFPTHSYKGAAQRRGCQIKGHTYKVGEVVRSSSGPCLHCTCGGDGQMKCDPKACTPEPMLRQMIAAAVSAKRRR